MQKSSQVGLDTIMRRAMFAIQWPKDLQKVIVL